MADDSKDEHFDDSDFSLINTPEDEAEDVSMNSAGNNEASASVSGAAALFGASLSSQAVEDTERPKSSVVVSDPMTQSQFAQVIFHDIADSYPNDCDLCLTFSFNANGLSGLCTRPGDRIGLYQVPKVNPLDFKTFVWISNDKAEGQKMSVAFRAADLPKAEDDMYQFQYLRSDNSVLGASLPFHLKSPKTEELCAVENEEGFNVIKSRSALASETHKDRASEYEKKYVCLLEICEKQNEDLNKKEADLKTAKTLLANMAKDKSQKDILKNDLAKVVQRKLELEQELLDIKLKYKKLQDELMAAQNKMDQLQGHCTQLEGQTELYKNESEINAKKAKDVDSMLVALSKSKDMAVSEIQEHILQRDEAMKEIARLNKELTELSAKRSELDPVLETLKNQNENLEMEKRRIEEEFGLYKIETGAKIEKIMDDFEKANAKMVGAMTEKEQLIEKMGQLEAQNNDLEAKNRSVNAELQVLKMARDEVAQSQQVFQPAGAAAAAASQTPPMGMSADWQSSRESLEKMIYDLQMEMRLNEVAHASEIRDLKTEIETVKAATSKASSEYAPSEATANSSRLMDSMVIQRELVRTGLSDEPRSQQPQQMETSSSSVSDVLRENLADLQDRDLNALDNWANGSGAAAATSVEHSQELPLENIIPTLPSAVQQQEEVPPQSGVSAMDQESVPPTNSGQPEQSGGSSMDYVLTADGRTVPVEVPASELNLSCPICGVEFEQSNVEELRHHVENHLEDKFTCPMCNDQFEKSDPSSYEHHVRSHFGDDEDLTGMVNISFSELPGAASNSASAPPASVVDDSDSGSLARRLRELANIE